MMPEGVEHTKQRARSMADWHVALAVMPEGVEHHGHVDSWRTGVWRVALAVMPEGVEHM